jgi:hypothetical protein
LTISSARQLYPLTTDIIATALNGVQCPISVLSICSKIAKRLNAPVQKKPITGFAPGHSGIKRAGEPEANIVAP